MSFTLQLTHAGSAALAAAIASGECVIFGAVALSAADPDTLSPDSVDIGTELWRDAPASVSAVTGGQVRIRAIVPASAGGWTSRALGVFAGVSGTLLAYAALPQAYKPLPAQDGAGALWTLDVLLTIGTGNAVAVAAPAVADWLSALIASGGGGGGFGIRSGETAIAPDADAVAVTFSTPFPPGGVPVIQAFVRQPSGAVLNAAAAVEDVSLAGCTVRLMSAPETPGYILTHIAVQP
ncbi:MAG: phage tail protein [Puniceicoccales bacterium]|jgi:hypothetical protein|nr:phage tail protein [Puniceicoccales bacterium]